MERAYVRRQDGEGHRWWDPIGWYCQYCGDLVADPDQLANPAQPGVLS